MSRFGWMVFGVLGCQGDVRPVSEDHGALAAAYVAGADEAKVAEHLIDVREHPELALAWSGLAVAMLDRKRETASEIYLQYAEDAAFAALDIDPTDLVAQQVAIRALHDRHRFAEAAQRAGELASQYPDDTTLMLLHGDALLELGRYDESLEVFQRALDARPDLRTYDRGAYLRWLYGDLDGAIELAVQAIKAGGPAISEPTAFCYVDLATFQLHAGSPDLALQAAAAALALVPDYALASAAQGRAQAMLGDTGAAIATLDGLTAHGGQVVDLLLLADLKEEQGQADEARATFAKAEARGATDPRAIAEHLARHRLDPARALALAEKAVSERPTIENLDTWSLALLRAGKVVEAAAASERATALGTADPRLHLHRGLIAAAAGDLDAARQSLARADERHLRADPLLRAELAALVAR